jgi:rhodanese-related sulfurtransferase
MELARTSRGALREIGPEFDTWRTSFRTERTNTLQKVAVSCSRNQPCAVVETERNDPASLCPFKPDCMWQIMTNRREPSRVSKGYKQLIREAANEVDTYSAGEAIERLGADDVTFVDVRDASELGEHGEVPGAVHAPRGMLEFHIDPESPFFIDSFGADSEFVFVCAIGSRSMLAAHRAREMGLDRVANIEGGFNAWKEAGGPFEEPRPTM